MVPGLGMLCRGRLRLGQAAGGRLQQSLRGPASAATAAAVTSGDAVVNATAPNSVARRHLRVTHTPPMMPPPAPINTRYNYAAFAVIMIVLTWAALAPEDDGFNSVLASSGYEDEGDEDDDEESYDGKGYEGRDKAVAGGR